MEERIYSVSVLPRKIPSSMKPAGDWNLSNCETTARMIEEDLG
jgi:hypothetical protein